MRTIDDLDESVEAMYAARLRLIEYITPALYLEVTATDVMGVRQLTLEFAYIWQQIRFQALNIPAATRILLRQLEKACGDDPGQVAQRFVSVTGSSGKLFDLSRKA